MRQALAGHAGLVFAGLGGFILMGAGQALFGPALPAFTRDYGLALGEAGLLVSAQWVGSAFGVGGMFLLGDRVTPRMALAVMALGVAVIASGLAWGVALLGAVIFGIGYGACTAVLNPRFLRTFGDRGPAMVGLLNAAFGLGAIAAPLVFIALGSRPTLAFAGVAVLAGLVWLGAGRVGEAVAETRAGGRFRFRPGILAFGVVSIGIEASLIGLGPTALIAAGVAEDRAAALLSMFFVSFLVVRLSLLILTGLLAPFTLFVAAMGLAGLAAIGAILFVPGPFFVMLGISAGLFFPTFFVCATQQMGADPRVAPTIIAAGLVGGITMPLVFGAVLAWLGAGVFFWLIGGVCLIAAALGALSLRGMNRAA